jgi:hypothetical protein
LLAFDCFRRTDRKFVDLMTEAFSHVAAQTGPEAAIGFTMTTLLDHPVELLIRPTRRQVRSMLDVFQSYTEHGIVVLPANFFDRPVANLPETRSGLKSSRALVVHQILRGDTLEYDEKNCDPEIEQCATMPYAIDLVVPTTNGNNSVVVPAVLGTIALMKNANPSLTNEEIMAILTDPAYFSATVTVGRRTVPVLDALEAVNAARPSEILVPILQGSDDAGPDPGLGCSNFTDRNEVYFAKCLNGQTDVTSGFRFIDLPIPRGARILDAHIEFTVDGPYDNEIQLEIIGEKKTLAGTFGPGSWPSQRAVLTNASVAWTIAASDIWDMGQTRTTPNLSAILQEIVNLRRWNLVNNGVVILVRNAGPAEIGPHREYHRRVFAFERDPARAARLVVRFVQVAPVKFSYFYSFGDLSGTNSMMPGDIFTIWDQPWGGSIFNDTAQCLTNNRGQIRAYNHDRLSEDGPGTLGQWKSQGCSTAEEFGYVVECCVVP